MVSEDTAVWKRNSFLKRNPRLTPAKFSRYYETVHGPLAARQAGFRKYTLRYMQNHVQPNPDGSEPPFDGMLAYALLKAYEITGNVAYRDGAQPIISRYLVAPVADGDVNRVLMIGLGLAQYRSLNSDPVATTRLDEILLLVARSQHADGSFDHVCDGARDVHYTTWTAMELDLIPA